MTKFVMTKYYYTVNEKLDDSEDRYEFEAKPSRGTYEDLVTEIAQYDWDHNGGYEFSNWPNDFHLWDKDHNYLGSYEVHMDMLPFFYVITR